MTNNTDSANSRGQKYFLETSIQFVRMFGLNDETKIINDLLRNTTIYSSYFVLKEFHSLVTLNLIEYYAYLDKYKDVGTATKIFVQGKSFRPRRIKSLIQIISSDIAALVNLEQAKTRVDLYIRESDRKFKEGINYMIDQVQCPQSKEEIMPGEDGLYSFFISQKLKDEYSLPRFFKLRRAKVETLYNFGGIQKASKDKKNEFKNLKSLYLKILRGEALNSDDFSALSDTIISMECPQTACLLSYDEIFEILCRALGLTVNRLRHQSYPPAAQIIKDNLSG